MNAPAILVVYAWRGKPLRSTSFEHLQCFRRYARGRVSYLNLSLLPWVPVFARGDYDLIVFDTLFLSSHWGGEEHFRSMMKKAAPLAKLGAVMAILPQDEFYNPNLYCEFIAEMGIDHVFSVAPEAEWRSIYRGVDRDKVKFHRALTGYLDDRKLPLMANLSGRRERSVDIGYRTAGRPFHWYGRHGFLKEQIADVALNEASSRGLKTDISVSGRDTIHGDDWYRFLAKCKCTIGSESGTSIIDHDGSVARCTWDYAAAHPKASFEEVEAACFPGLDGTAALFALGPRHLEACATRTCQILIEGDYSGVLKPGTHYIPVKKDFSDVAAALDRAMDPAERERVTGNAFRDIAASGRYTYSRFVQEVIALSLGGRSLRALTPVQRAADLVMRAMTNGWNAAETGGLMVYSRARRSLGASARSARREVR